METESSNDICIVSHKAHHSMCRSLKRVWKQGVFSLSNTRITMDTYFTPNPAKEFYCEKCDFICRKQSDYNRHLSTAKHTRITNNNEFTPKNTKAYVCICGSEYKHSSGLSKHKRKCPNK